MPGCIGSVDLRSLPAQGLAGGVPQGFGLFVYPAPVVLPAGALSLGGNLQQALPPLQRQAIASRLGTLPLDGPTLLDCFWQSITTHADPTGQNRSKPLTPTVAGNLELLLGGFSLVKSQRLLQTDGEWANVLSVWQGDYRQIRRQNLGDDRVFLGRDKAGNIHLLRASDTHKRFLGELVQRFGGDYRRFIPADLPDEGMLEPHTTISDAFTRADSDSLGADWTERAGDWDIVSNRMQKVTGTATANVAYHNTQLSSANYYVQVIANLAATGQHRGPCARRVDFSTADSGLYAPLLTSSGTDYDFYKRVSGTWTNLNNQLATYTTGVDYTLKIEVDGSTMKSYFNGTLKSNFTDSSLTAIGFAGVVEGTTNGDNFDDLLAEDLVAGDGAEIMAARQMIVVVR
jgi:hypothetical protein